MLIVRLLLVLSRSLRRRLRSILRANAAATREAAQVFQAIPME